MGVIKRLGGYSLSCDTCDNRGFIGTHKLVDALVHFGLMNCGYDENGEVMLKCANGCKILTEDEIG